VVKMVKKKIEKKAKKAPVKKKIEKKKEGIVEKEKGKAEVEKKDKKPSQMQVQPQKKDEIKPKIVERVVKPKKRKGKGVATKAKKKRAVARAAIKKGKGFVHINSRDLNIIQPSYVRELIEEPLELAGDYSQGVNIKVNVHGGGFIAQAVSARGAIAKALVEHSRSDKLRQKFIKYDRMLLVDDSRRTEAKKPLGTKARKKKQKSKR